MPKTRIWLAGSLALSAVAVILSAGAFIFSAGSSDRAPLNADNFGEQVRSYLLENPDVIATAIQRLEERQQAKETDEIKSAVALKRPEIFDNPGSPVGGNPQGDVTLVEFFDYNCPYCRKADPIVDAARKADTGLRIVYKEYPILGPGSVFAARAALASQSQGKYLAFHQAMMSHAGAISEGSAVQIAQSVGLDLERLKKDMEDPAVANSISRNLKLAQELRITGTPSFVLGGDVVRGLVALSTLQERIAQARGHAAGAN